MRTVPLSAARQRRARLLDEIAADKTPLEIVRRGKPSVVLVEKGEFEGMLETLHLLSSPPNAERLVAAIAELEAGMGQTFDPIHGVDEP